MFFVCLFLLVNVLLYYYYVLLLLIVVIVLSFSLFCWFCFVIVWLVSLSLFFKNIENNIFLHLIWCCLVGLQLSLAVVFCLFVRSVSSPYSTMFVFLNQKVAWKSYGGTP